MSAALATNDDGIDALRTQYERVFMAANPERPLPRLSYERGWWCIRANGVNSYYRTSELRSMVNVLRERASRRFCF